MRADSIWKQCLTNFQLKRPYTYLLLVVLLCLPLNGYKLYAQQNCTKKTVVIFGNGMFTDFDKALEGYNLLRRTVRFDGVDKALEADSKNVQYNLAYNDNEFFAAQFYNVVRQKLNSQTQLFWHWLANKETWPDWFRDLFIQFSAENSTPEYVRDTDLQAHVNLYKTYLNEGSRVIIVSHSQGNFYANNAYNILSLQGFGENIGNVQVATPVSFIAAGGNHYTTFEDDDIMNSVRRLQGCLQPNMGPYGHLIDKNNGHSIVAYMTIPPSRVQIMRDIKLVGGEIKYPCPTTSQPLSGRARLSGIGDVTVNFGGQTYSYHMILSRPRDVPIMPFTVTCGQKFEMGVNYIYPYSPGYNWGEYHIYFLESDEWPYSILHPNPNASVRVVSMPQGCISGIPSDRSWHCMNLPNQTNISHKWVFEAVCN